MKDRKRILIVEDDASFRALMVAILEDEGHELTEKDDGKAALMVLQRQEFDLVLSDLRLPGMGGLELFRTLAARGISTPFVLLTAFGTIEEAVAAMKEGVADFLTKPLKAPEALRSLVRRLLAGDSGESKAAGRNSAVPGLPPDELQFAGAAMRDVRRLIGEVAPTLATVLITGESGTGKELAALSIHLKSNRAKGPFVAVNCAAIPENLLESELFGHEKGAFTGATQSRQGKFELASGGTLFLDEIGEMPLLLQAKILRALQERVFERVGGSSPQKADVRIVAATNRNLQDEVSARRFREDLFYRLNVFPVHLPPLRERRDGIPLLLEYLAERAAKNAGKEAPALHPDVVTALVGYNWPGNIREMQNLLERAVILAGEVITTAELPGHLKAPRISDIEAGSEGSIKKLEREAILEALDACGQNRRMAAERLGISKRTLQYRLKEYGLVDEV